MAIIKKSKLREMTESELQTKLFDFQKELNTERGLLAAGGRTSNPGKIRTLRKTVARVMTLIHEKKLGIIRKFSNKNGTEVKKTEVPEKKKVEQKEEKKIEEKKEEKK